MILPREILSAKAHVDGARDTLNLLHSRLSAVIEADVPEHIKIVDRMYREWIALADSDLRVAINLIEKYREMPA